MRQPEYDTFYTKIVLDQSVSRVYMEIVGELTAIDGNDVVAAESRKQLQHKASVAAKLIDFAI